MGGSSSTEGSSTGKDLESHHHHQQQQHQQGSEQSPTSEADIYPLVIKKEPEDLTRRNIRHGQHHHPESRLVCSNNDDKVDGGGSGGTVISRVLADGELVHEILPRLESISHGISGTSDSREAINPSGSVIHIRRPLSSQQQTDGESMIPSVALDLARAGIQSTIQQQYSSSSYNNAGVVGGLTTIQTSSNLGYDSSPGTTYSVVSPNETSAYTTINAASALRHQQGSYSGPAVGSGDPFYRDYFNNSGSNNNSSNSTASGANNEQQYSRAVAQLAYAGGDVHEGAFVDRFVRNQAGIYKQQQQGTGLTVDLPSPDSGIGVDAVTPREQSVAQQVRQLKVTSSPSRGITAVIIKMVIFQEFRLHGNVPSEFDIWRTGY
jgi:hypothetical protein